MSISDAEFEVWLDSDARRVVLAEMQAYVGEPGAGGAVVTHYLSDKGYQSKATDTPPLTCYDDIITAIPGLKLGIDAPLMLGNLEVANDGSLNGWLDDSWGGRSIVLLIGDPAWPKADFRPVLTGVIDGISGAGTDKLIFSIRDRKESINRDFPLYSFQQDGSAMAGKLVPTALGTCYNVPLEVQEYVNLGYWLWGPNEAVTAVRDNGTPKSYGWDSTKSFIRLTASPSGNVTADVQGLKVPEVNGGAYTDSIADLVRLALLRKIEFAAHTVTLPPGSVSWTWNTEGSYTGYFTYDYTHGSESGRRSELGGSIEWTHIGGGVMRVTVYIPSHGLSSGDTIHLIGDFPGQGAFWPIVVSDASFLHFDATGPWLKAWVIVSAPSHGLSDSWLVMVKTDGLPGAWNFVSANASYSADEFGYWWTGAWSGDYANHVSTVPMTLYYTTPSSWVDNAAAVNDGPVFTGADIDSDSFAALDALVSESAGRWVDSRVNWISLIDEILASVGAYWYFGRDGLCRLWRLDAPTGVLANCAMSLSADDWLPDSMSLESVTPPIARVRMGGRRNWTQQDRAGLAGSLSAADKDQYSSEYLAGIKEAAGANTTRYLNALRPDVISTVLVDATAEASRIAALYNRPRQTWRGTASLKAMLLVPGDEVFVTFPALGFESGKYARVVGIEPDLLAEQVTVEFWL